MRHFIQYHNAKDMEYSASRISSTEVYTDNPVESTMGNTVWLVSGEGMSRKKKSFYLAAAFKVESFEVGTYKCSKFKNTVAGSGSLYGLSIQLDWNECFLDYKNRTQFQSRGLHAIDEHDPVIQQFIKLSGYTAV